MVKPLLLNRVISLVENYNKYFKVQAKRRSVHVNGYCGTELNLGTDTQQISDICQVLKKSIFKSYSITKHLTEIHN